MSYTRGQRSAGQVTRKVMQGTWGRSVNYDKSKFIVDEKLSEKLQDFSRVEIREQPTDPEDRRRLSLHDARTGEYMGTAIQERVNTNAED